LEALIDAARRGAKVRLLLDGFFDEPEALHSSRAGVEYLSLITTNKGLDLAGATGHPIGGIHAKFVLLRVGGEVRYKVNREVVLIVDHPLIYVRLLAVFPHDWAMTTQ
jgi:cardiolipin synthase A/B